MKNLETKYDPKKVEDRLYNEWVEKGYFHAKPKSRLLSLFRLQM